jgi:DNA invertase Pin-like site-specific DNA recombinase
MACRQAITSRNGTTRELESTNALPPSKMPEARAIRHSDHPQRAPERAPPSPRAALPQRQALIALGVAPDRIYIDQGMSGTNRERPGLDQALAAVRGGDTLVVPKLDRLACSVPDARDIGDTLAQRGVTLSLGGRTYDPDDPMGKMLFNILATFAEFEVDLIRMRTREGMAVARAQGKLKGRQPKLTPKQQRELKRMHETGEYTITDLGELFSVSRPTVCRTIKSHRRLAFFWLLLWVVVRARRETTCAVARP